ncbi:hypothetical protein PoB_004066300 [Plakobranchus ocellatus]|uniref:Uncharacterized protein n=1 Tax=Plakobranchus ocellatus TaxID=259542 RepID=A0AAV4B5V6_9GAST|nr:hypothetical protein PoB_004066300 [Plakobranchus ocellatus]
MVDIARRVSCVTWRKQHFCLRALRWSQLKHRNQKLKDDDLPNRSSFLRCTTTTIIITTTTFIIINNTTLTTTTTISTFTATTTLTIITTTTTFTSITTTTTIIIPTNFTTIIITNTITIITSINTLTTTAIITTTSITITTTILQKQEQQKTPYKITVFPNLSKGSLRQAEAVNFKTEQKERRKSM